MTILGIETSCDETGAAIIEAEKNSNKVKLLSNIVASSVSLHAKTGGIIPEVAAREQVKYIIPVIKKVVENSKLKIENLDAIAVTVGPGLIGSLLVGVETAKTLSYVFNKPVIPVNHLIGHIYANFVSEMADGKWKTKNQSSEFPAIALIASGGHTDLILMRQHGKIKWLGGTRDDAAGEAFDKIGRLLELPYPGGPLIEKNAALGNSKRFNFPKPLIDSKDFDFSFSGLKTAAFREILKLRENNNGKLTEVDIQDICACLQKIIIDILIYKTLKAAKKHNVKSILLGGGVSANQKLKDELKSSIVNRQSSIKLFVPDKKLCTDNAAMIAAAGFFNYKEVEWQKITANPELYFD
ncbi:MAG: tRNA (adenosine(37)-N6)-threonylcarbamoyltransferase complex transferase subunit TsaD [Patescibacteria group bacterium]|nr:tRNA (adenosine(37)-N6)-threonylcarbamoyltransferase complex transferase subunit TsaD [Patescibacteria group bacterium]